MHRVWRELTFFDWCSFELLNATDLRCKRTVSVCADFKLKVSNSALLTRNVSTVLFLSGADFEEAIAEL